jgi:uncharacterized membrane protein YhaH (DUF805 family)
MFFHVLVAAGFFWVDSTFVSSSYPRVTIFTSIYLLIAAIPFLSLMIRRLHDTDNSALWFLVGFIPVIGNLLLLWALLSGGTKGLNRFGPDPRQKDLIGVSQ